MAIDPKTLHPSVWTEIDRLMAAGYWGDTEKLKGKERTVVESHSNVWMKEYGPGCALQTGGIVGVIALAIKLAPLTAKSIIAMPMILIGMALIGFLIWRSFRQLSTNELKVLAPGLDLSPIQQSYVEAVLALDELSLNDDSKKEVVAQMNRLLDEEASLRTLRDRGGIAKPRLGLEAERDEIRAKLEAASDPVTREALGRSLDICERRLEASTDKAVLDQRIDAQLTMIAQSMGNMRDMLERLQTAPVRSTSDLDLSPLRQAIEQAQTYASSLEAAVHEVESVS